MKSLQANNHEEAFRMFQEAVAVDKHNQSYRGLLRQAKQEQAKATRKDFYGKWEKMGLLLYQYRYGVPVPK